MILPVRGDRVFPMTTAAARRGETCREGDGKPVLAGGWCKLHYRRWQSNRRRFKGNIEPAWLDQCWIWQGTNFSDGRPCFYWRDISTQAKKKIHAFRAGLILRSGPYLEVLPHWEAAHRCHNDQCVNPTHGFWALHPENCSGFVPEDPQELYSPGVKKELGLG